MAKGKIPKFSLESMSPDPLICGPTQNVSSRSAPGYNTYSYSVLLITDNKLLIITLRFHSQYHWPAKALMGLVIIN